MGMKFLIHFLGLHVIHYLAKKSSLYDTDIFQLQMPIQLLKEI